MASPNPNPLDVIKALLVGHFTTCMGCRRPNVAGSSDAGDWAFKTFLPVAIVYGIKCPNCQSPEERAEVAIRQASGIMYKLEGLRLVEEPKQPEDGDDGGGSQAQAS